MIQGVLLLTYNRLKVNDNITAITMPLKTSFLFLVGIPNPNDDPPVTDVAYESSMSDDPRVQGDLGDSSPFRASPLPAPRSLSKKK